MFLCGRQSCRCRKPCMYEGSCVKAGMYIQTTLAQVSFGMPLAESLPVTLGQLERSGQSANRVMAFVSATLQRNLNLEQQLRSIIGDRLVACHDGIPAHSPRPAVWQAMLMCCCRSGADPLWMPASLSSFA